MLPFRMRKDSKETCFFLESIINYKFNRGSTVGPKMQNGRGRGKFIKKGDRQ